MLHICNAAKLQYSKDLKDFLKKDGIAQRVIATSIERRPLISLYKCETAKEMWDKLHGIYESRSEASVHVLQ